MTSLASRSARGLALLGALLGALLATGCASFESGELPFLETWPPPASAAPTTLTLELSGMPSKFQAGWERVMAATLLESERFSDVTVATATSTADRHLRIDVTHSRPDIRWTRTFMYLCAFTAGILPARAANDFALQVTVLDGSGNALGTMERSVGTATWVGWVFVFALPFAGVGVTPLIEDTTRSILLEGVDRGWL